MQFVKPIPFTEAQDKFGDRSIVTSTLSSSEWSDVPVALKERAFFSSRVESARFLQRAQDSLGDFLEGNLEEVSPGVTALATGGRAAFVDQMQKFLAGEGVTPGDGGLQDITSEKRLGLIFNTVTRQADDYGYWRQGMDPDVLNQFPAQRFIRVLDVKEPRQSHSQYQDQVYLKTDPIWARVINADFGVPWGPWGWGCGHDVEDVDRDGAIALNLIQPDDVVQPQTKFFNENLQASTRGLDPDLISKLKNDFGDQLVIDGDTMYWRSNIPAPTSNNPIIQPAVPAANAGRMSPVSDAIDIQARGTLGQSMQTALAAIDKVHDDGTLPTIPMVSRIMPENLGEFQSRWVNGVKVATDIAVTPKGPWPALTAVHEVGHFLDLSAIGDVGQFATVSGFAPMRDVLRAAEGTNSIKGLRALLPSLHGEQAEFVQYLLSPKEIWARAYAQYIAQRSGNIMLATDLAKALASNELRQWTTADFAPVATAIDNMFKKLGWI